ncbi:hypothetical protein QUC31_009347 [Theobroma cacao]|uniref:Uncharacterized protein LOC108662073 n=1 Tax=Theobroma cacao TaxID=3641 RepID=A0AB32WCR2_THECC|nr:PREDICTED: uncharacterized protein LOC108662073 [Theobroma cacao]
MAGRWATSAFRRVASELVSFRSSILRWPQFVSSSMFVPRWGFFGWPELSSFSFSVVDDVVWGLITAFESVALVSMLCFFFLFCGCTV